MTHGNLTILNTLNVTNVNIVVILLSPGSSTTFSISKNTWTFGFQRASDGSYIYSNVSSKLGGSVFRDIMTGHGVRLVEGGATVAVGLTIQGQIIMTSTNSSYKCPARPSKFKLYFFETGVNAKGAKIEGLVRDMEVAETNITQSETNTARITRNAYCPKNIQGKN